MAGIADSSSMTGIFGGYQLLQQLETANPLNCNSLDTKQNVNNLFGRFAPSRFQMESTLPRNNHFKAIDILYKIT